MKFELLSEKPNALLDRKEITVKVLGSESSPTRAKLLEEVPPFLKTTREKVVINTISQSYGAHEFVAQVDVYSSPESLKRFAHPKLVARGEPKQKQEKK